MSALSQKETRALLKSLRAQGTRVTRSKKGWMLWFPDGSSTALHYSNSDWRSTQNLRSVIRRAGLDWPTNKPRKKEPEMGRPFTTKERDAFTASIADLDEPITTTEAARRTHVSEPTAKEALIKAGFTRRAPRGPWFPPMGQDEADVLALTHHELEFAVVDEAADPHRVSNKRSNLTLDELASLDAVLERSGSETSPALLSQATGVSHATATRRMVALGWRMQRRGHWMRPEPVVVETETVTPTTAAAEAEVIVAEPGAREFLDSVESWTVPVPAKLAKMARELGLNIECRVWRDK